MGLAYFSGIANTVNEFASFSEIFITCGPLFFDTSSPFSAWILHDAWAKLPPYSFCCIEPNCFLA